MTLISQGIHDYLARLAPTETHQSEVRRYRQRLHDVLNSHFDLMAFYQSGSFKHGTAVMPMSDVDYIARIMFTDQPKSSNTILNKMRDLLRDELWEAHEVRVDRPTVTVDFPGILTHYEITPAYLERAEGDHKVVHIPAPGGAWRLAAPTAHREFISRMDKKHTGDVKTVARLLKAWKREHGVPISSFYLEMRAAEYGKNNTSMWPFTDVKDIVDRFVRDGLPAMNDPTGLVGRIQPTSSAWRHTEAMVSLRKAQKHLSAAHDAWIDEERWDFNQGLQGVWGSDFPYCDP